MPDENLDHNLHVDSTHAKIHSKNYVKEESYLHVDQPHKDWYNRREMGKQGGKPHYAPPKVMKQAKNWKKAK